MNTRSNSIFPSVPGDKQISGKDGDLTTTWALYFENLTRGGQINFKSQGFVIPPLSNADINALTGPTSYNNIVYNSTNAVFEGNVNGNWIPFIQSNNPVATMLSYAGNPNGNVAGTVGWMCTDSVGHHLYFCTTTGSSNGTPPPQAIWTLVV